MKILHLNRYVFTISVTSVLLAGCGGSQPTTGGPGALPQSAVRPREPRPDASPPSAIYVANEGNSTVTVYKLGTSSPRLTISAGIRLPVALGIDTKKDLWVANCGFYCGGSGNGTVTTYSYGKTAIRRTITKGIGVPFSIAAAPSGDM